MTAGFEVIAFYKFAELGEASRLAELKGDILGLLRQHEVFGTVILASEGINASLCGKSGTMDAFLEDLSALLGLSLEHKRSFHNASPFRKQEVKIRPEIVTLKQPVDISLGDGTHVSAAEWNRLIADPEVFVLDTRNDYEFRSGTFRNAVNPATEKFSELPAFVERAMDPATHTKIAMFCTGGIRCEKFAPYMLARGFREVYQLDGGILKYLEEMPPDESLWEGECFVFDERVTLDPSLKKGSGVDLSGRRKAGVADLTPGEE